MLIECFCSMNACYNIASELAMFNLFGRIEIITRPFGGWLQYWFMYIVHCTTLYRFLLVKGLFQFSSKIMAVLFLFALIRGRKHRVLCHSILKVNICFKWKWLKLTLKKGLAEWQRVDEGKMLIKMCQVVFVEANFNWLTLQFSCDGKCFIY